VSFPVVFRREAKGEFDEAVAWYEGRRAGLGKRDRIDCRLAVRQVLYGPPIHGSRPWYRHIEVCGLAGT
jgi:hypothetical protein